MTKFILPVLVVMMGSASEAKMSKDCEKLQSFLQNLNAKSDFEQVGHDFQKHFPQTEIRAKAGLIVVVFEKPLSCFQELTKKWEPAIDIQVISPPPVGPKQKPLALDPKDNPYIWVTQTYQRQGWKVSLAENENRIKSVIIKK